MTKDQFSVLLESIQSAELQVREDGQLEYSHDENNCFANFDRVAGSLKLDRKRVLLVYALKHWDGIVSYVNGHVSQREDVRGRIKDLRMYLALLWGMVEEEDPIKPIISVDEARSILLGPECSHERGCGYGKERGTFILADNPEKFNPYISCDLPRFWHPLLWSVDLIEVTTQVDGPNNRKFIPFISRG